MKKSMQSNSCTHLSPTTASTVEVHSNQETVIYSNIDSFQSSICFAATTPDCNCPGPPCVWQHSRDNRLDHRRCNRFPIWPCTLEWSLRRNSCRSDNFRNHWRIHCSQACLHRPNRPTRLDRVRKSIGHRPCCDSECWACSLRMPAYQKGRHQFDINKSSNST